MAMTQHPRNSNLRISKEVVISIVKETVMKTNGVSQLSDIPVSKKDYILRARLPKPIIVDINGDTVKITVGITVKSGQVIKSLSEQLQKSIKDAVQSMTGIAVYKINIYIAGMK